MNVDTYYDSLSIFDISGSKRTFRTNGSGYNGEAIRSFRMHPCVRGVGSPWIATR